MIWRAWRRARNGGNVAIWDTGLGRTTAAGPGGGRRPGRGTPARAGNAGPGGGRRSGRGTTGRAGDAGAGGGRRSGRGTPERAGDDGRLAGLGELRAAVEGGDVTPVAALLLLRLC